MGEVSELHTQCVIVGEIVLCTLDRVREELIHDGVLRTYQAATAETGRRQVVEYLIMLYYKHRIKASDTVTIKEESDWNKEPHGDVPKTKSKSTRARKRTQNTAAKSRRDGPRKKVPRIKNEDVGELSSDNSGDNDDNSDTEDDHSSPNSSVDVHHSSPNSSVDVDNGGNKQNNILVINVGDNQGFESRRGVIYADDDNDDVSDDRGYHSAAALKDESKKEQHYCVQCKKWLKSRDSFVRHMQKAHKQHQCPLCDKTLTDKGKLQNHIRAKHMGHRYNCSVCDKTYETKLGLSRHEAGHNDQFRYKCEHCDRGFNYKTELDTHLVSHTGIRPHACEKCSKAFIRQSDMRKHMEICGIKSRDYMCDICLRGFKTERYLKEHVETHTSNIYQCKLCDKTYMHRSSFFKHKKSHEAGEKTVSSGEVDGAQAKESGDS